MIRRIATSVSSLALSALLAAPALAAESEPSTTFGIPDGYWKFVNMVVFFGLLGWLIIPAVRRFLDTRREEIQARLVEAEERLAEAEEMRCKVMERLEAVEAEVEEMQTRAEAEGAAEAERIRAEADEESRRFLDRVDDEIGRRTAEKKAELAAEAKALTASMARELLSDTMTDADRQRVFDRSVGALDDLEWRR